jgi:hypothetical protein
MLPYLPHYQRVIKKNVNKNVNIFQPITAIKSKNILTFTNSTLKTYRNLSENERWTGRDLHSRFESLSSWDSSYHCSRHKLKDNLF